MPARARPGPSAALPQALAVDLRSLEADSGLRRRPVPSFAEVYEEWFDFVYRSVRRLGLSDPHVDDILHLASIVAARADSDLDVECCMSLTRSALGRLFGHVDDGLDIISSQEELTAVLGDPVARFNVVRAIEWCAGSAPCRGPADCRR